MKIKVATVNMSLHPCICSYLQEGFKEEIKAVYGYENIYSVSAVSGISALSSSGERQNREHSQQKQNGVSFANVLEKSLSGREREVRCSMQGYGKTGAYEEYLYLKREYRQ